MTELEKLIELLKPAVIVLLGDNSLDKKDVPSIHSDGGKNERN